MKTELVTRSIQATVLLALICGPDRLLASSLVFQDVTVVDTQSGHLLPGKTVVVEGPHIATIGPSAQVSVPDDAEIVDASGGFLIPGLWDMHTHIFNNNNPQPPNTWHFPLLLANGVTGIRDMFVKPGEQADQIHAWRRELEAGTWTGPRIGAIGTLVDGAPPIHNSDSVTDVAETQAFVQRVREAGIDFVKTYNRLTPDAFLTLVEAAREAGLYVAGHVPDAVSAADASNAGQRSIEHLSGVHYACSSQEEALRSKKTLHFFLAQEIVASHDSDKCAALYKRFAAHGTWQVPTLIAFRPWTQHELASLHDSEGLVHTPVREVAEWQPLRDFLAFGSAERKQSMAEMFALQQRIVREMAEAGVLLLAGTDVGNPYVYPGFSLIDELEELVRAGLSPLAVLQTATLNPARYLDRTKDLGLVEEGKLADLVLLEANPLEDIGNLRKIRAVVVNGRLFKREELERMTYDLLAKNYRKALDQPPPLGTQPLEISVLKSFVGTYQRSGDDARARVLVESEALVVSYSDWKESLEPLGGALFRVPDSNVLYVFLSNANRQVWGFEVNDGRSVTMYSLADTTDE